MYHVEVLPNSSTHLTPGWTYVPDRGFDPAKAAITPAIGRKRGIRDPGRTDLSSRQTNAIVRHLAELDRENHRDVHIPIPTKQKDTAGRGTRGKVTSNVRRILQSQKTFRNYLDDEEAALAQATQTMNPPSRPFLHKVSKPSSLRRSSTPATTTTTTTTTTTPKPETARPKKQSSTRFSSARTSTTPAVAATTGPQDTGKKKDGSRTPADTEPDQETEPETEPEDTDRLIKSEHDNDPLLRSYVPSVPSERIMQALLAEPPLSYNASRASLPLIVKAPRYFCLL
ncbi:putative HIT finger domain protein [Aspergillus tanneri]|uniref:Uncharacterized protein n=1 Tax=Aspergillus tanneri TaxID=1220188 RepID=A0A5M9MND0_9EURO|nr:uncharacterized protein ATNIH1004_008426 [Aspergillus tanneri]KAA8644227.1 hypothetical protein ATNIH1004_008426 [Aspergillus tanneri]